MSFQIFSDVKQHAPQKGSKRMILLFLAFYANDEGQAFPSVGTLAKDANLTLRFVQKVLAQLKAEGAIEIEYRPHHSSLYTIVRPWLKTKEKGVSSKTPLHKREAVPKDTKRVSFEKTGPVSACQKIMSIRTPISLRTLKKEKKEEVSLSLQREKDIEYQKKGMGYLQPGTRAWRLANGENPE